MNNLFKSIIFLTIFVILYIVLSYLLLPKTNLHKYGLYNTSMYEILGEKSNTIDIVVIGDSLVYSSISPMDIYGQYGYTMFDCSEAAQILPDAYNYFKIAIEIQKPKVVILEANILFRDANKRPWYNKPLKVLKNSLPLVTYHNNWKRMLFSSSKINGWINVSKGYKKNMDIKSSINYKYMKETKKARKIPEANYDYLKKIVDISLENDIKLILVGFPSQKSWTYKKHNMVKSLAEQFNLDYINLNINDELNIDWVNDTKDSGDHLNYFGAKKVSKYIGSYLKDLNILTDHKGDPKYEEWNKAYNYFLKN